MRSTVFTWGLYYFKCKHDTIRKLGFSSYGVADDLVDEYMRMSESTWLESLYKFCKAIIEVFGLGYLRECNAIDTTRLLLINASRGFSEMLGRTNCMH